MRIYWDWRGYTQKNIRYIPIDTQQGWIQKSGYPTTIGTVKLKKYVKLNSRQNLFLMKEMLLLKLFFFSIWVYFLWIKKGDRIKVILVIFNFPNSVMYGFLSLGEWRELVHDTKKLLMESRIVKWIKEVASSVTKSCVNGFSFRSSYKKMPTLSHSIAHFILYMRCNCCVIMRCD